MKWKGLPNYGINSQNKLKQEKFLALKNKLEREMFFGSVPSFYVLMTWTHRVATIDFSRYNTTPTLTILNLTETNHKTTKTPPQFNTFFCFDWCIFLSYYCKNLEENVFKPIRF